MIIITPINYVVKNDLHYLLKNNKLTRLSWDHAHRINVDILRMIGVKTCLEKQNKFLTKM